MYRSEHAGGLGVAPARKNCRNRRRFSRLDIQFSRCKSRVKCLPEFFPLSGPVKMRPYSLPEYCRWFFMQKKKHISPLRYDECH